MRELVAAWLLNGLESGLLITALSAFLGATVVGLATLAGRRRGRAVRPMLGIGAVALTLLLGAVILREGHPPVLRRYEVVVLCAWAMAVGGWIVGRRVESNVLEAAAAPCLFLLTLFAVLLVPALGTAAPDPRPGKLVHVVLAVLGFVGFTVAAGTGALYLWQIRVLKRNPTAAVARRLPPLERLDRVNFLAAAFGFPFLALSVAAGWLFIAWTGPESAAWWRDPTVVVTLLGLLAYAVLFLTRIFLGWYGRRIAWLSLLGFLFAVVGFVVARFCTASHLIHTT